MIDWDNDGDIDLTDLLMTEMILEEDDKRNIPNKGSKRLTGNCLSTLLLMIIPPAFILFLIFN